MAASAEVWSWAAGLDSVVARVAPRFGRAEPRRRAGAYLRGLLAPVERKNGWQLIEAACDATPDGRQEFLSQARWNANAAPTCSPPTSATRTCSRTTPERGSCKVFP